MDCFVSHVLVPLKPNYICLPLAQIVIFNDRISKTPSSQKNIRDCNFTFLNQSYGNFFKASFQTSLDIWYSIYCSLWISKQESLFHNDDCLACAMPQDCNCTIILELASNSNEFLMREEQQNFGSSAHIVGIHIEFTTSFSFTPEKEARARGQRKNFLWTWCHHLHHITIFSFRIFCLTLWPGLLQKIGCSSACN